MSRSAWALLPNGVRRCVGLVNRHMYIGGVQGVRIHIIILEVRGVDQYIYVCAVCREAHGPFGQTECGGV